MKHWILIVSTIALATSLLTPGALAQRLVGSELVDALKKGGYVIVLRHARSPREAPDERTANPDNTTRERQLDQVGREDAMTIGKAMRELGIPMGTVLTSPTYRARETVRFAGWDNAQVVPELGDRGQSMQGVTDVEGAWLRKRVTQFSPRTNTILVTHLPNITRAFPTEAEGIEDGDALVFGPSPGGAATVIGRIEVGEWRTLKGVLD
jgi:phosphohistidine phosphatase SixA